MPIDFELAAQAVQPPTIKQTVKDVLGFSICAGFCLAVLPFVACAMTVPAANKWLRDRVDVCP